MLKQGGGQIILEQGRGNMMGRYVKQRAILVKKNQERVLKDVTLYNNKLKSVET